MTPAQVLAALSLLFFVARLALFIQLHRVASPYGVTTHAVSDYAVGPTRRLSLANAIVSAMAWFALAAAFYVGHATWADRLLAAAVLSAVGALSIASVVVPTDLEGQRPTARGIMHYVLAIASFGLVYFLMGNVVRLASHEHWPVAAVLDVLQWVALAALIAVCLTVVGPGRKRLFGIAERVYLGTGLAFYALAAVGILSH